MLTQQWHYMLSFAPALVTALALGTLIGWERFRRRRAPTVSTFIVLAAASCMAVRGQILLTHGPLTDWTLAGSVLTGVGFCGAAFIVWRDKSLEGVTTGMTVFCTAVVGVVCGLGLYLPAAVGTVLTLAVMAIAAKVWPGTDDARNVPSDEDKPDH